MRYSNRGFTLVEVLLAMAITVLVGVLAYNSLSVSIDTAGSVEVQAKRLAAIQTSITLLERDVRHAAFRGIVDEYGNTQTAMLGGAAGDYLLQLSRFGWENPRELQRGTVQRVRYQLIDGQLWREYWPVLDRISEEEGKQRLLLLDGINNLTLRFLNSRSSGAAVSPLGGEWQDYWRPGIGNDYLPRAVELVLEIEQMGEIKRVFAVAGV